MVPLSTLGLLKPIVVGDCSHYNNYASALVNGGAARVQFGKAVTARAAAGSGFRAISHSMTAH